MQLKDSGQTLQFQEIGEIDANLTVHLLVSQDTIFPSKYTKLTPYTYNILYVHIYVSVYMCILISWRCTFTSVMFVLHNRGHPKRCNNYYQSNSLWCHDNISYYWNGICCSMSAFQPHLFQENVRLSLDLYKLVIFRGPLLCNACNHTLTATSLKIRHLTEKLFLTHT